ncbi:MAG: hypothetical protein R3Y64_11070, partial [Peptostreptococcaceae bacterium]
MKKINKKAILLSAGALSFLGGVNSVDALNNEKITFTSVDSNNRGIVGNFNGTYAIYKNPSFPNRTESYGVSSQYPGNTYLVDSGVRVESAMHRVNNEYGYTLVYYAVSRINTYEPVFTPKGQMGENIFHVSPSLSNMTSANLAGRYQSITESWNSAGNNQNIQRYEIKANMAGNAGHTPSGSQVGDSAEAIAGGAASTWRYLGYSGAGETISNTHFMNDSSAYGAHRHRAFPTYTSNTIQRYRDVANSYYDNSMYDDKLAAIQRLLAADPSWSAHNAEYLEGNVVKKGPISAGVLMDAFTMLTNPDTDTPVFRVYFGTGSSSYGTIVAPAVGDLTKNVKISKIEVYNSEDKIAARTTMENDGKFTRENILGLEYGEEVRVVVSVANTHTSAATTAVPLSISTGAYFAEIGQNIPQNEYAFSDHNVATHSRNWAIQPFNPVDISYTIKIPEEGTKAPNTKGEAVSFAGDYQITAKLNDEFDLAGENHNAFDDQIDVYVSVGRAPDIEDDCEIGVDPACTPPTVVEPDPGDLFAESIELINKSGQVVEYMVPGEEYKTRFKYQYNGP